MRLIVDESPEAAALSCADALRDEIEAAVALRGRCMLALSGGRTSLKMLEALSAEPLPWSKLDVFQADERAVSADDERRTATWLREILCAPGRLPPQRFHPMPVETPDLERAAADYEDVLERVGGVLPTLDVVQLGLGADGHTASLVPGDDVLDARDRDVAATTAAYQGVRRLTLAYPLMDRARRLLWLVTGEDKVEALAKLMAGDRSITAGRVARAQSVVYADAAAAARVQGAARR